MVADKNEITRWVKTYTSDLVGYTIGKINDKQAAEDIVQNTFLAALESIEKFKGNSTPRTWLFSILKHKIADHYRSKYKQSAVKQSFDPLDICFDKYGNWEECHKPQEWKMDEQLLLDDLEFNSVLKSCYENLPAKWAAAIQLKYFQEDNSQEICYKINVSVTNFWQMIHRAKVMLRLCLETNWFSKQEDV
jgi:RNA polymerase sigma-70 factor (ECF subfamily)